MTTMSLGPKWPLHHWGRADKGGSEHRARGMTEEERLAPALGNAAILRGSQPVLVSPTQPHTQPHTSTLAVPHSKHGLRLLPNAIQVHVGSCGEQERQRGAGVDHVQERWGAQG